MRPAAALVAALIALLHVSCASAQSATPAPSHAESVAFYTVEARVETTSDWTVIDIGATDAVLASRTENHGGGTLEASAAGGRLTLRQPLDNAKAGKKVAMTVRLALEAGAPAAPLKVVIEKGAIGTTSIHFFDTAAPDKPRPLGDAESIDAVPGHTDRNRREFTVDASALTSRDLLRRELRRAEVPKMVWAFYYPWYGLKSWDSKELNDRPAQRYASDDPEAIKRHIDQAKSAGIDGFICSWWGPSDRTDKAFRKILDAAQEKDFRVTIYFETLDAKGGRPEKDILRWLRYFLQTYSKAPALMRVGGKPLILLWASGSEPPETWRRTFQALRADGLDAAFIGMGYDPSLLDLFDGLHEYGVFNIPDLAPRQCEMGRATRSFGLLDNTPATPRLWCATAQPGYDERPIPGRRGLFKDRDAGAFYRSTWDGAIASDPDWIFITTWNEWWEHTAIEPGEKEGDLYLNITREYSRRWKAPQ